MYYTTGQAGKSIMRAGMDGSKPTTLVTELEWPYGITMDFETSQLFWTDFFGSKVESSDLRGADRKMITKTHIGPSGITCTDGRLYWGEFDSKELQSSAINGDDQTTLYTDKKSIAGVIVVPDLNRPPNRTNPCGKNSCAGVCVLTATSSRCLK